MPAQKLRFWEPSALRAPAAPHSNISDHNMALWKKILVGLTTLCLLLAIAVSIFLSRLADGLCGNSVLFEYPSPNGRLKAVIFERNCGATTGFSTQVSILPIAGAFENEGGNLFSADTDRHRAPSGQGGGPEVRFRWVSDTHAELQHHQFARIFSANANVKGVQVVYVTFNR